MLRKGVAWSAKNFLTHLALTRLTEAEWKENPPPPKKIILYWEVVLYICYLVVLKNIKKIQQIKRNALDDKSTKLGNIFVFYAQRRNFH